MFFNRYDLPRTLRQANPQAPLPEQVLWLERLFEVLRNAKIALASSHLPPEVQRIQYVLQWLDQNPTSKIQVAKVLQNILGKTSALRLLSQTGILRESGLLSEATDRIFSHLLPTPVSELDMAATFAYLFSEPNDDQWVEKIDESTFLKIIDLLSVDLNDNVFTSLKHSAREALLVLGTHIAELGLSRDIRERMQNSSIMESPFLNLNITLNYYVVSLGQIQPHPEDLQELHNSCVHEITLCRQGIKEVYTHLEDKGVSVEIVYRLEGLMQSLARIEWLMQLLQIQDLNANSIPFILKFIALLIREQRTQTTLRGLIQDNLRLISKKIVERIGATGEHYITRTQGEYLKMLLAGAGGGAVMGFTTIAKFYIAKFHLPLFFEGFFHAINYAGTFVFLKFCHFTLATKQPAMTGPALALKLSHIDQTENLNAFVDEVVQIMRSQFAAIVGNVGLVIPATFVLDFYYRKTQGNPIFSPEYAIKTVASLHPIFSLTIFFAILTGVLLWLSAIFAGWLENWFVFRRLSDAIGQSRKLNRYLGKKGAQFLAQWMNANIGSLGGNISIGLLLAFTPIMGQFFGLPLDVRHVTLSTGYVTLAASSLIFHKQFQVGPFCLAALGIGLIGFLNVLVSFLLALSVAMRARNIRLRWIWGLMKVVFERFKKSPKEFFWVSSQ